MQLVVMGVSGSGKSTLAVALVMQLHWAMAEGDDYHSAENKAKMAAGMALNDEDRRPWLHALHAVLAGWQASGASGVMTCSALKEIYRAQLSQGLGDLRFVWLDPPRQALEQRLAHRTGHYMNPRLLDSQLETLEPPRGDNVLHLAADTDVNALAAKVVEWILNPSAAAGIPPID
ncbi:MAG TPA: gluconokinase [Terracidiphilus sp.]|jgi:gluconokinase|nr:gluconokinase [Terracidiphilus sp.]